jgi:hypothetical protein
MVLEFGHFGRWIKNIWKFFKCGAEEDGVGLIVLEMKKCQLESKRKEISHTQ